MSITDDEAWKPSKRSACTKGLSRRWSPPRPGPCAENDARKPGKRAATVVNLSGRGDKDIFTVHDILKLEGKSDGTLRISVCPVEGAQEGAFVPFVTLGDPGIEQSLKLSTR